MSKTRKTIWLSKSRISSYRQCPKRLWLDVHRPDLREESAAVQSLYAVGHDVGALARAEYSDGVLIGHDDNLSAALQETGVMFAGRPRKPVFEATFRRDGVLIRADLMIPRRQGWHMAEVKSTGELKDYHLDDLAVQAWVVQGNGIRLTHSTIRHIDKTFIYRGGNDYTGLFTDAEAGEQVSERLPLVPDWTDGARKTLAGREPNRVMGKHCNDPFACTYQEYCGTLAGPVPDYPVDLLPNQNGKKLALELQAEGYADLRKVPASRIDHPLFQRMHRASVTGKPYRDAVGAAKAMAGWDYPRAYLDFETIGFTVPIWEGTKPFEQLPFQWSCHIESRKGKIKHCEFLDLSGANPARGCAEQLVADLAHCNTIVAYNASFERGVIKRLAERFPDLRKELMQLHDRVVDLLPVVREHYYHRDMQGSYSIKAVLPTLAPELDYATLGEVQDGTAAQHAYLEAINTDTEDERKKVIREALKRYCGLDSIAMIKMAGLLKSRIAIHVECLIAPVLARPDAKQKRE